MTTVAGRDGVCEDLMGWLSIYQQRIGVTFPSSEPTVSDLNRLTLAHIQAFPFEMLDYFLDTAPTVDLDIIRQKFLLECRGGGCSQQNALFAEALRFLGVRCHYGMARVPREDGRPSPRAHMILFLEYRGHTNWLCDVGYGMGGPLYPLRMDLGVVQKQGCHEFRIVAADAQFLALERYSQERWKRLYVFDLRHYDLQDFEPANYFNTLSPKSIFTRNLIVSRPTLEGGVLIRNRNFIFWDGEEYRKEAIQSLDHLVYLLQSQFLIRVEPLDFVNLPTMFRRMAS
ncbi:arylamine N-acetyltransferase family protein [Aestuariispira ectoiniformans]|uniref:arylamine N-acetyltransferase family protein n=1 Tax=Aestuariispira ectoiniformans TaxID=2775080 RepID=UPI00223AC273|nr:arylamine N-acetyltransferase [Aestuariispira ectoiniformans]